MGAAKLPFQPDEILYLKQNFYTTKNADLRNHINSYRSSNNQLSCHAFRQRCYNMGLVREFQIRWSKEDTEKLRAWYKLIGDKYIAELLNQVGTSTGVRNGVKIKRSFTRKNVEKKRSLLGLKRTPEQIKNIICDNRICGEMRDFTKTDNLWTRGNRKAAKEHDTRIWKNRKYIKINNRFIPYTRWFYNEFIEKVPSDMIVFHLDFDALNDNPDNLDVRKKRRLSLEDFKKGFELISNRLNIHSKKMERYWDRLDITQRADLMKEFQRLSSIKEKLLKHIEKEDKIETKSGIYFEPIEAF